MVKNCTASFNTDRGLNSLVMSVTASYRVIYTVNIKNTLNIKRDYLFYNSQVSTFIGKCFQI
ncbi:hypothetical protein ADIARSV_2809 [Arcticibacter svalbardensis MN12-7]|uniref:Uncharacterized protein n=1 Tax=Arcticibacter svalbardensis MN12-7 TaxID=1150600 RepID=R9GQZ5_9SPHI|nr:hypothetical protein ADIARSV_2809 [Arcticibacter svalbardensis MN12-7]